MNASAPFPYTEMFERLCPEYMAMGMTYDEYWNQDCLAAKYFKKSYDLKRDKENFDLWLQGKYFYEALLCASPILRAFSSAKEPIPYPDKPYALTEKQAEARKEEEEERKMRETKAALMNMFTAVNTKRREKGDANGKS